MNIYPSFRYQLSTHKVTIIVYYSVFVGAFLLMDLSVTFLNGDVHSTMNGLSASTFIVAFVMGLCSFKENFAMALQNGVSRRSLFLSRLCTTAAFCAILAVLDEAVTLFFYGLSLLPNVNLVVKSILETAYGPVFVGTHPALIALCSILYSFFLLLTASGLGYFITVLFYRLNKPGKIAVGVGVPVFPMVIIPLLKELNEHIADGKIGEAAVRIMGQFLDLAFGQPQNAMLSCFLIFAVFSGFTWLLLRRASLKA